MEPTGAPIIEDYGFVRPPVDIFGQWYIWVGALLLLVILYFMIKGAWKRRKIAKAYEDRMAPKRKAIADLKAIQEEFRRDGDMEKYSLGITLIMRTFLEELLGKNCSKQTATQFIRSVNEMDLVDGNEKMWLNLMIQKCELAKFADEELTKKDTNGFYQRSLVFFNDMTARREALYQEEQRKAEEELKNRGKRKKAKTSKGSGSAKKKLQHA